MGIKGLYTELPLPERKSFVKLTAESYRDAGRPLRLAVDFAIWQYQNQAAQGGTNPAIRTLFYRLARLKAASVQAIFVFDGPHKPKLKRNKRSGRGPAVATAQAKKLIHLFGFHYHDAPGEAEAECALLQRQGVVDAVLSEDVDTVMFGCTKSLRNWSSESGKSTSTPTHVSIYDAQKNTGNMLDREGMILAALMSGGDYSPDGLPGFGIKVACEAARAGYGKSLCRLKAVDTAGFQRWREELGEDLRKNEHRHFQRKHPGLKIPTDWPDLEILRYYTNPVVSPISVVDSIRPKLDRPGPIKLEHLREFTREEFGWDFRIGALKFIRVIATAVLSTKLQDQEEDTHALVRRISSRREHFSADGEPELRLGYVPLEVVPIDLSQEVDEIIPHSRDALAVHGEMEEMPADIDEPPSSQPKLFDPEKIEAAWMAEEFVTRTAPSVVKAWKEAESAKARKKLPKKKQAPGKKSSKDAGMAQGALDAHFKVVKPVPSSIVGKPSKLNETNLQAAKSFNITPHSIGQHRSVHAMGVRQHSKPPTPTRTKDQSDFSRLNTLDGSPLTTPRPRNNRATQAETILISSSPPGPTPFSPLASSYNPRTRSFRSTEIPDDVCADYPQTTAPQSMRGGGRARAEETQRPAKSPSKLKQTSITMFATRVAGLDSSQRDQSQSDSDQRYPGRTRRNTPDTTPPASSADTEENYSDDSSMAFPPLSSLVTKQPPPPASPKSPAKRVKSPNESERDTSPTRASKSKKTLLVPDATGFVRVLRVDADKRDELELNETRRLVRQGARQRPIRQSDVAFVDLTEG